MDIGRKLTSHAGCIFPGEHSVPGFFKWVSSVFWRITTPSTTYALFRQRPPQLCQHAAVIHFPSPLTVATSMSAPTLVRVLLLQPDKVKPAAPTALAFKKFLRLSFLLI